MEINFQLMLGKQLTFINVCHQVALFELVCSNTFACYLISKSCISMAGTEMSSKR